MNISQIDFSNLRLDDVEPKLVKHNPHYIKEGSGVNAIRRIFFSVPFDSFEIEKIREMANIINKLRLHLPENWTEADILRYLYAAKFNYEKAINMIQTCLEWRNNRASWTITRQVQAIFESGTIYINGRDKLLRPILVIDLGQLNALNVTEEDFNAAATIMLDIMIENCFVPGKVENADLILMSSNLSINKLPLSFVKNWINLGTCCYPHIIDKIFVVRPPLIDRISIKVAEAFMEKDTASKIEIIDYDKLIKLQTWISPSQLENKLGGSEPNMTKFWPPIQTARTSSRHAKVTFSQNIHTLNPSKHITKPDDRFDFNQSHLDDPSPRPRGSANSRVSPRGSVNFSRGSESPKSALRQTTGGRIMTSPSSSPEKLPQYQQRVTVSGRINTTEDYSEPLLIIDDHMVQRPSLQEKVVRSSAPRDSETVKRSSPPQVQTRERASTGSSGKVFNQKFIADPSQAQVDLFTEAERLSVGSRKSQQESTFIPPPSQKNAELMRFTEAERFSVGSRKSQQEPAYIPAPSEKHAELIREADKRLAISQTVSQRKSEEPLYIPTSLAHVDQFEEPEIRPSMTSRKTVDPIYMTGKPVSLGYHEEFIRNMIYGQPQSARNSEIKMQRKKSYTLEDASTGLRSSDNLLVRGKVSSGNKSEEKAKKSRAPQVEVVTPTSPSMTDIGAPEDEKVVFDSNVYDADSYLGDTQDKRLLNMIIKENRELSRNYQPEVNRSLVYETNDRKNSTNFDQLNIKFVNSEFYTPGNAQSAGLYETNATRETYGTRQSVGDDGIERWSKVQVRREMPKLYKEDDERDDMGDFCGFCWSRGDQKVSRVNK